MPLRSISGGGPGGGAGGGGGAGAAIGGGGGAAFCAFAVPGLARIQQVAKNALDKAALLRRKTVGARILASLPI